MDRGDKKQHSSKQIKGPLMTFLSLFLSLSLSRQTCMHLKTNIHDHVLTHIHTFQRTQIEKHTHIQTIMS